MPSTPDQQTPQQKPDSPPLSEERPFIAKTMPRAKPLRGLARYGLLALSYLFLFLGLLGVLLPGLPTTPFILLAAYCATRSSPKLHRWLYQHPVFGSILHDWEHGGRVSRKAKITASLIMLGCAAIIVVMKPPLWAAIISNACMFCIALWLWFRPEP